MISRRPVLRLLALAGATANLPMPVIAQPRGSARITMAAFGGGTGEAWATNWGRPFAAETGIDVRVVEVPSTESTLISGARQQQYNASIHSYAGASRLYKMGITEALRISDFPVLQEIPRQHWLMADADHVIGIPTDCPYYGVAFHRGQARAEDFRSWRNLADAKWREKLAVTRPVFASLYDLPWLSHVAGGNIAAFDRGLPLFRDIARNALTVYNSMAQMNQLLQRGEVTAAPYYSARIWAGKREGVAELDMVIPAEGAMMIPYILVVPKNCPFPEAARRFANWSGGAAPVERAAEATGYLPLNSAARLTEGAQRLLGMPMEALNAQLMNPDWNVIEAKREEAVALLEQTIAQLR